MANFGRNARDGRSRPAVYRGVSPICIHSNRRAGLLLPLGLIISYGDGDAKAASRTECSDVEVAEFLDDPVLVRLAQIRRMQFQKFCGRGAPAIFFYNPLIMVRR